MGFIPANTIRDRLAALMVADALWQTEPAPPDGPSPLFPNGIGSVQLTTVSEADDIACALVTSGFRLDQATLGPRTVGKAQVDYHLGLMIFVYCDVNANDADRDARATLRDQLTMQAVSAMFHYEVDPTPDSQGWLKMKFVEQDGMTTTYRSQPGWRMSLTLISLSGQQRKS